MSDPEVIIIPVYKGFRNDDDYDQKVAFIESMPEMQGVKAVKNKNYIKVNLSELVRDRARLIFCRYWQKKFTKNRNVL